MKKFLVLSFLVFVFALGAAAQKADNSSKQSQPDISGTWKLSSKQSNRNIKWATSFSLAFPNCEEMTISQNGPEIKITQKCELGGPQTERVTLLHSDGRDDKGTGIDTTVTVSSKTKWHGNKLVTTYTVQDPHGTTNSLGSRTWQLSADGKTITSDDIVRKWQPHSPGSNQDTFGPPSDGPSDYLATYTRID